MRTFICILISLIGLTSCIERSPEFYDQTQFEKLISLPEYKILDTIQKEKSTIIVVYQDEGALGGHRIYFLHKTGSSKFHSISYPDSDMNIKKLENTLD
jgi:hypothetical protein